VSEKVGRCAPSRSSARGTGIGQCHGPLIPALRTIITPTSPSARSPTKARCRKGRRASAAPSGHRSVTHLTKLSNIRRKHRQISESSLRLRTRAGYMSRNTTGSACEDTDPQHAPGSNRSARTVSVRSDRHPNRTSAVTLRSSVVGCVDLGRLHALQLDRAPPSAPRRTERLRRPPRHHELPVGKVRGSYLGRPRTWAYEISVAPSDELADCGCLDTADDRDYGAASTGSLVAASGHRHRLRLKRMRRLQRRIPTKAAESPVRRRCWALNPTQPPALREAASRPSSEGLRNQVGRVTWAKRSNGTSRG